MANFDSDHGLRVKIIIAGVVLVVLLFVFKLVQLQLIDTEFVEKAQSSALYEMTTYPSRGLLYDRNNRLLVQNEAIYDLYFTYNLLDPKIDTLKFCELLDIDIEYFKSNINKDWNSPRFSRYVPTVFLRRISPETFARFQEHLHEFPGFEIELRNVRSYPHENAAHILGYISEANREIIDAKPQTYELGDYLGSSGIEQVYEPLLKGNKGLEMTLRDNLGRYVGSFNQGILDTPAVSGHNLQTTIDLELQGYAEKLLKNKKGSVIAIEPATGEILTMVSSPTYDPNKLVIKQGRGDAFMELASDSLQPLFNRSVQAKYPPGSIFKTILALIALQEEIIDVRRHFTCQGAYYYKNSRWGCTLEPGRRNVSRAIQRSCNSFFYQTYREIIEKEGFDNPQAGLALLNRYLHEFGLGKKLQIDLPHESSGRVPDNEFYQKLYAEENGRWYSTYILSNAIGQGELEFTNLQIANLATILANRGFYITPHLVRGIIKQDGNVDPITHEKKRVPVDETHFEVVIDAMEKAVSRGSGRMAYIPGLEVCGKTGTSENPHGENHSVFFAFAPKDNPKIAVAVYVENAGYGSTYAAPIAGLIIEQYLQGEISRQRQWVENRIIEASLLPQP